ncbi:MAG: hypothetical protein QXX17_06865 [Conexivisphaerales archaeon]
MNIKALIVSTILLVSAFAIFTPVIGIAPIAYASSGHPTIFVTNGWNGPNAEQSNVSVGVRAGTSTAAQIDGSSSNILVSPAYVSVNMTPVSFSGAQFYLVLDTSGLSSVTLNSSNIPVNAYAGPFPVSALAGAPTNYTITGAVAKSGNTNNFTLGTTRFNLPTAFSVLSNPTEYIQGPIPGNLPGGTYYIKVFDGSSGAVAVGAQKVIILPSVSISVSKGPAGAAVTVSGAGFSANGKANLTVSNNPTFGHTTIFYTKNITANAIGQFVWSPSNDSTFLVPDLGLTYTGPNPVVQPEGQIYYAAMDYGSSNPSNSATYTEQYRDFQDIAAYNPGTGSFVPAGPGSAPFGNFTSSGTSVDGYVTYALNIVGNYFNPSKNVSFLLDGAALPSSNILMITGPFANGTFIANLTVPIATKGNHFITVVDASGNLTFQLVVQTTLAVSPTKGPEGTTVTVTGYGFDKSKSVTAYWFGLAFPSGTLDPAASGNNQLLFNSTTDSTGTFTFTFTVPSNVYGGTHLIFANDSGSAWADATFSVKPSWSLSPSTAPLGTVVNVNGVGLPVGSTTISTTDPVFKNANGATTGAGSVTYTLSYDNLATASTVLGNATGFGSGTVVAAGYPMVHYVGAGSTYLALNVTGTTNEGATIEAQLSQILSNQQTILSDLNSLSSAVASNANALSSLQTSVNKVDSDVQSVGSSVSQLSSTVSQGFSSTGSSLSGIQQTLGTLATSSGLQSVSSTLNNVSTFLYVAIALAAIVLILEIVILVRRR